MDTIFYQSPSEVLSLLQSTKGKVLNSLCMSLARSYPLDVKYLVSQLTLYFGKEVDLYNKPGAEAVMVRLKEREILAG